MEQGIAIDWSSFLEVCMPSCHRTSSYHIQYRRDLRNKTCNIKFFASHYAGGALQFLHFTTYPVYGDKKSREITKPGRFSKTGWKTLKQDVQTEVSARFSKPVRSSFRRPKDCCKSLIVLVHELIMSLKIKNRLCMSLFEIA